MKPKFHRFFLSLVVTSLLAISYSQAGQIWDGGGLDSNWGTVDNWDNNTLPTFGSAIYTGATFVNEGILTFSTGGRLTTTSAITTASGATVNMTAQNQIASTALTVNGANGTAGGINTHFLAPWLLACALSSPPAFAFFLFPGSIPM